VLQPTECLAMKLCLFLVAGAALAAQDTPPVISLSLSTTLDQPLAHCDNVTAFHTANGGAGTSSWHWNNKAYQALNCPAPCHKCEAADRDSNTAQSVTCEVQNTGSHTGRTTGYASTDCPEPRCTVYDHYQNRERNHVPPACAMDYFLVNNNGAIANNQEEAGINRGLRSEWLIRYSAEDAAGNQADNVTFTMIFVDTQAPELTTEFGLSGPQHDRMGEHSATYSESCSGTNYNGGLCNNARGKDMSWLQSCSLTDTPNSAFLTNKPSYQSCNNNLVEAFADVSDPCVYTLKSNEVGIKDNYDMEADIKGTIEVSIYYKPTDGGSWTRQDGSGTNYWNSTGLEIDTRKTGDWQVRYQANDLADIFGYNEQNNVVTQTVDLTVSDDLAPIVTLNAHHAGTTELQVDGASNQAAYTFSGSAATDSCTNGNDNSDFEITLECRKPASAQGAVVDGTKHASDPNSGSFYVEPGAQCKDLRGSWTGSAWSHAAAVVSGADMALEGSRMHALASDNTHEVVYTCSETAAYGGASATRSSVAYRTITVEDRIPPAVQIIGQTAIQNSAGSHNGNAAGETKDGDDSFEHDGTSTNYGSGTTGEYYLHTDSLLASANAQCNDMCNPNANNQVTSVLYYGSDCSSGQEVPTQNSGTAPGSVHNFPEHTPGDYSIQYTCYDGAGAISADETVFTPTSGSTRTQLTHSACLHIENVDKTKPIIQVLGSNVMTLEATHSGNYVDDGATCWDRVDGVISQNVEVSGDVVNLSKVGTYVITYNCKDSAGNSANPISRTVYIAQTTCPRCTITSCPAAAQIGGDASTWNCTIEHEASFTFTDPGAVCQDDIDGSTATVTTGSVDTETTGEYILTYRSKNSAGLWNDEATCDNGAKDYFRTVNVVDTLVPVVEVKFKNEVVGRSEAEDLAVHNDAANPAKTHTFMAEETTQQSSAWVLGAVASSLAGVALLAASRKRNPTVSVPV